jgi:hypothetical protein
VPDGDAVVVARFEVAVQDPQVGQFAHALIHEADIDA